MSYLLSFYRVISEMQTGRARVVRWQKIMGCHITSWSTVYGRASIWHSFCALVRALYYHRSENKLNRTTISCRISCVGHTRTYAHVLSVSVPHTHTHRETYRMCFCVVADLHRLGQPLPGQVWLSAPHQGPEPGRHRWSPAGTDHPDHR